MNLRDAEAARQATRRGVSPMVYLDDADRMLECNSVEVSDWVPDVVRQIQVIDYELHASLRIIANGEIDSIQSAEFAAAIKGARAKRDQLMTRVFSYLAEMRKQSVG